MATAKQIAAAKRNLVKARARRKGRFDPDKSHGSGTGLNSAYRYINNPAALGEHEKLAPKRGNKSVNASDLVNKPRKSNRRRSAGRKVKK